MHPRTFRNHIRNREKKLNQMSSKSRFQIFFLGMVYTLSEADGERKRLEGILEETQTRLQNAERTNIEQSEKIKDLERDLKVTNPKRGLSTKEQPSMGAAKTVETASLIERKKTIVCDSFSDDNKNVTVSSCKRHVKFEQCFVYDSYNQVNYEPSNGCCFLNHQKIKRNQILKWSLRVPKFQFGKIGMVNILE